MKRATIAVDMDDVLGKFVERLLIEYNFVYGDSLKKEQILSWNIHEYAKRASPILFWDLLERQDFFKFIEPYENALYVLEKLRRSGHDVTCVTSSNSKFCYEKERWLRTHMRFKSEDIIYCKKKHMIVADYLIDDYIGNLQNFNGKKVLYSQPHNHMIKDFEVDIRVRNWKEIEQYFILEGLL